MISILFRSVMFVVVGITLIFSSASTPASAQTAVEYGVISPWLGPSQQAKERGDDQKELKAGSRTKKDPENEPRIRAVPLFDPVEAD